MSAILWRANDNFRATNVRFRGTSTRTNESSSQASTKTTTRPMLAKTYRKAYANLPYRNVPYRTWYQQTLSKNVTQILPHVQSRGPWFTADFARAVRIAKHQCRLILATILPDVWCGTTYVVEMYTNSSRLQ